MTEIPIGGSCPDCGSQYGEHAEYCEIKRGRLFDPDDPNETKRRDEEIQRAFDAVGRVGTRIQMGKDAYIKMLEEVIIKLEADNLELRKRLDT